MKNFFPLFFCVLCFSVTARSFTDLVAIPGPSIVGEWQLGSSTVGSNKANRYVFLSSKIFEYYTNNQDALIEVLKIRGTYSFKKDTVYVRPTAITRRVGGHLSRNFETPVNDFWELNGGTFQTFKIKDNSEYPMIIKVIKPNRTISINGSLYYKI